MKKEKKGFAISTDTKGKFFATESAAKKYIKKVNQLIPADCAMKEGDIYVTTNDQKNDR